MTETAVRATTPNGWIDKLERDAFDSDAMARQGRFLQATGCGAHLGGVGDPCRFGQPQCFCQRALGIRIPLVRAVEGFPR